jgi:hypothetical protein
MSTALPAYFCQPSQYFRQCFRVAASECEEVAASATRVCLDKHKADIPAVLVQPKDGTRLGNLIGSCAGGTYEVVLAKKRLSNAKCNDPANWQ